ncbi:TIGR01244 family phosphatase [Alcanivorax sp. JB21]|uniref:TIGR01244 family sulfur transferase n=1 Tax=Alcanivorax limicola TaxID=2874102 RepID=UPI001CBAC59B|nr:TIGR01244 family sulfur transferase [Alcanivorax limicola]MBZ2190121.1 TIGR01244 family phosphatase [Alcanivorax limicola]
MDTPITQHTDDFATCGQITAADIALFAEQGFRTLINNRPDGEGGAAQPLSEELARAAAEAGIAFVHLPVVPGQITAEQASAMRDILAEAEKPVLAFCRSGARSTNLWQLAGGR